MKSEKYLRFYFASILILVIIPIGIFLSDVVATTAHAAPPKEFLIQQYYSYDNFQKDCYKHLVVGWKVNQLEATSTSTGFVGYIIVIYEK